MIWNKKFELSDLNKSNGPTNPLGLFTNPFEIEFVAMGEDFLIAKMPITANTKQPMGLLHGGVSVYLAETVGSYAANLAIKADNKAAVGLDINANHIRGVKSGFVYAKAKAIHIGGKTQVWSIEITDESKKLTCICRLTMAVISI